MQKRILSIIKISLLSILSFAFIDYDVIYWRKLSYEDFRGPTGPDAAQSATSIVLIPQQKRGNIEFIVRANFIPTQSYCKVKTERILAHEQRHFDITELFTRKIRVAIKGQSTQRVYYLYDSLCVLKNEMQDRYDKETEHSVNEEMQQKWNEYIHTQL